MSRLLPLLTWLLAHHPPEDYHRCTFVGFWPVCRRCLFLYPLAFMVLALQYTPLAFSPEADPWLFALAMPAALEFGLERLQIHAYHPSRVAASSLVLALPMGRGFARYLENPWDLWFWGLVLGFGIPTLAAALIRAYWDRQTPSSMS